MCALETRILEGVTPSTPLGVRWETLVKSNQASGCMQSLNWADLKRKQGLNVVHVGIFLHDEMIAGAMFYAAAKRNGAGILIAPEGPVLPWQDAKLSAQALRLIIDTIQVQAADLGIMAIRIEPRIAPPPPGMLREFGRAPVNLVPRETLYVDLSMPEESILAAMKPKGRYNIALGKRHGVEIVEDTSTERVNNFYQVVKESSERDGFALEPFAFFQHIESALCPEGIARFLLARHEGDVLGALLLMTYGSRGTYLYGGITNRKRNLMAGYALQWSAMIKAKEAGCTVYDFYGINEFQTPDHPYSRFSQFKSQFGGNVVTFIGAHEYFYLDNLADVFIKVVTEAQQFESSQSRALRSATGVSLA